MYFFAGSPCLFGGAALLRSNPENPKPSSPIAGVRTRRKKIYINYVNILTFDCLSAIIIKAFQRGKGGAYDKQGY